MLIESLALFQIIINYYQTNEVYKTLSLAIPVESIIQVYPELKENNNGLKPFFDFVRKIRHKREQENMKRLMNVYVPPIEYDDIKKSLER